MQALNFLLEGYLGDGGAASLRIDSQGKTLGEQWRSREIEVDRAHVERATRRSG